MLLNKHLNKITVLASVLLISTPVFAANADGGKKATQAALDTEISNRISADQTLQNNIDTISLTPGPQGPKGDVGAQGIQGLPGVAGAKGEQGIQGVVGVKGDQGIQGTQGDIGLTGAQGIAGVVGAKGDKGDQGIAGTNGSNGMAGADGTSCSAIQGNGSATISCEDGTMASVYDGKTPAASVRKTYYITNSGQAGSEMSALGIKPERTLTFNKLSNESDLRLTHVDLRRNRSANSCTWELRIDGQSCPSGSLSTRLYTSYQSESSGAYVGYCKGISAGQHEIQVYVSKLGSNGYCWTGANSLDVTTTFLLEAEEVN